MHSSASSGSAQELPLGGEVELVADDVDPVEHRVLAVQGQEELRPPAPAARPLGGSADQDADPAHLVEAPGEPPAGLGVGDRPADEPFVRGRRPARPAARPSSRSPEAALARPRQRQPQARSLRWWGCRDRGRRAPRGSRWRGDGSGSPRPDVPAPGGSRRGSSSVHERTSRYRAAAGWSRARASWIARACS